MVKNKYEIIKRKPIFCVSQKHLYEQAGREGTLGCFFTLVPKVLKSPFFISWLNNFSDLLYVDWLVECQNVSTTNSYLHNG